MDYSKKMVWGFLLFVSFAFTGCTEKSMKDSFVETVNGVSFEMIHVDGQDQLEGFFIGQTEVTQELWEAVMGSNPSNFKGKDNPVENVNWNECQDFLTKLNKLTGKDYRLPTEDEWEFAAQGGNMSQGYEYSGSDSFDLVAWCWNNSEGKTHPVKMKAANELGLYDMSGNVFEWCEDVILLDDTIQARAIRGGSWWVDDVDACRISCKRCIWPSNNEDSIGFRLAL